MDRAKWSNSSSEDRTTTSPFEGNLTVFAPGREFSLFSSSLSETSSFITSKVTSSLLMPLSSFSDELLSEPEFEATIIFDIYYIEFSKIPKFGFFCFQKKKTENQQKLKQNNKTFPNLSCFTKFRVI